MDRRDFLRLSTLIPFAGMPAFARAAIAPGTRRLLVLVELKGGNDGLNTVVPYADPRYAELRPRLAIPRGQVVPLTAAAGHMAKLSVSFTPLFFVASMSWNSSSFSVWSGQAG